MVSDTTNSNSTRNFPAMISEVASIQGSRLERRAGFHLGISSGGNAQTSMIFCLGESSAFFWGGGGGGVQADCLHVVMWYTAVA